MSVTMIDAETQTDSFSVQYGIPDVNTVKTDMAILEADVSQEKLDDETLLLYLIDLHVLNISNEANIVESARRAERLATAITTIERKVEKTKKITTKRKGETI